MRGLFQRTLTDQNEKPFTFKSNFIVTKNEKVIFCNYNMSHTLENASLPNDFGYDKVAPLASIKRASFSQFPGIDELKISC